MGVKCVYIKKNPDLHMYAVYKKNAYNEKLGITIYFLHIE